MIFGAVLGGLGKAVAGGAVRGAVRSGMARGRRGKQRRRDGIQEKMFGGGGQQGGGGGSLAVRPSSSIVPFKLAPKSKESVGPAPTGGGILGILDAIQGTLSQILEVEKQQRDGIQQSILNFAKDKEQSQRTREQQAQEAKKPRKRDRVGGAIKNLAAGPLSWLQDFVKLGILNWISDPKNKEAVHNIVKFFKGVIDVIKWTWKWIVQPLAKFIWIITEPILKVFGSFFTFLGNLFTGKLFSDPVEFFRSLLDIPWKLIRVIPDIIGGFIKWLFPALWNSGAAIVGGIISAIKNLFGNIFGGGSGSKSATSGELGVSSNVNDMVNMPDVKDGKDGSKGDSGTDGAIPMGKGATEVPELGGSTYNQGETTQTKTTSDKPQGFMRNLAGVGDFMTGGLFDLDKRGDSGLQRVQKGVLDFATGGLTDFDGKGGKTWGTARLLGGFADKVTGDRWDFDRHGKSGTVLDEVQRQRKDLDTSPSGAGQETYAFGQDSDSAIQEVGNTALLGTTPKNGLWGYYPTNI